MNNCPNCAAPIDPYKHKCEYCGTWYYDLTNFNLTDNKPCYVKFKTIMNGQEVYITALAKPHLEDFEMKSDTTDIYSPDGLGMHSFVTSRYCNIRMRFECYEDKETKTLLKVEAAESEG